MTMLAAIIFLSLVMAAAWWVQRLLRNAGWVDAFWTFGLGAAGIFVAVVAGEGPRRFIVAALIGTSVSYRPGCRYDLALKQVL